MHDNGKQTYGHHPKEFQIITYIRKLKNKTNYNRSKYTQKAIKEVAAYKFCFHYVEKM